MLDTVRLWLYSAPIPGLRSGARLHRAALASLHAGREEEADRLFERAVHRYREELRVEAIARARVHQMIARVRHGVGAATPLEVERMLYRLDRIERLEPPFDLTDARDLMAHWNHTASGGRGRPDTPASAGEQLQHVA